MALSAVTFTECTKYSLKTGKVNFDQKLRKILDKIAYSSNRFAYLRTERFSYGID